MGHESTRFTRLVENLNYAVENLVPTFGSHRITQQQSAALGRTATQPANQKAIANLVYGGEWGKEHLGNQVAGDGWKYRGRGLKQITGLSNYRSCGQALKLDLVTHPELLEKDEYAARSAAWFSDYQQATATQINGITATVNGHTSAITTNAQAIANVNGDLKAMYNIKVGVSSNGQYYAAGMGIGVENTPSGMQSQVIFLADRFAVTHQAGATVTLPFVIQNGQVFIRDALIGDGTISNAKIGNYIQSNNYVAGSVGWRLDKGGTFENYGSTAGEGSMKQTNQTISVRDSRNVLRVQIGRITGTW
ncbi:DUF1983 domain-containing protein [Enterobacter hormaechei]